MKPNTPPKRNWQLGSINVRQLSAVWIAAARCWCLASLSSQNSFVSLCVCFWPLYLNCRLFVILSLVALLNMSAIVFALYSPESCVLMHVDQNSVFKVLLSRNRMISFFCGRSLNWKLISSRLISLISIRHWKWNNFTYDWSANFTDCRSLNCLLNQGCESLIVAWHQKKKKSL